MRVLVLDDEETRHRVFRRNLIGHEKVTHVRSYDEFVAAYVTVIAKNEPKYDVVYFDHDLVAEHYTGAKTTAKTGFDAAKYVAALDPELRPNLAIVHSMNDTGSLRICQALLDASVYVVRRMFGSTSGTEIDS